MNNCAIQVRMTVQSGDGAGVILYQSDSATLTLHLSPDGTYGIWRGSVQTPSDYVEGSSKLINNDFNQANILTVIVNTDGYVYMYVNGNYLNRVKNPLTGTLTPGVFAYNTARSTSAEAAFSDFKEWNI